MPSRGPARVQAGYCEAMSVMPSGRLSLPRLAWRQLTVERESSVAVAVAALLALLPAGLLLVETTGARSDLAAVLRASTGVAVARDGVGDSATFDSFQSQARDVVGPRLGQYVDGGAERAGAGPYRLASIGPVPPQPPIDAADVQVRYVGDLPSRVLVSQGVLPGPGTPGVEGTASATMPQALADRVGVNLFDQVCIRQPSALPADPPLWCARVVGIWRPASGADPAWTARGAPIQLFTGRDPYFALVGTAPGPQQSEATRQYLPVAGAISPQDATAVAAATSRVRSAADSTRTGQVRTTLDTDLTRYTATGNLLSLPVEMLTAALVPLLVLLAWVVARWYVEPRLHELALLRARGWRPGRVRRLVLLQFTWLGLVALALALLGVLALAWRPGLGPLQSTPGELLATVVAAAVVALVVARFIGVASWASRQSVLRAAEPEGEPAALGPLRGARLNSLLVLPAALLFVVSRVANGERGLLPGALGDFGAVVVSVCGLAMLVFAAQPALSAAAEGLSGGWADLEGTLARWQLRRWWQRHAASGFLIVFAFAIATFAAVALADQELNRPALGGVVLGTGVAVSLGLGFVVALAAALMAYGMVFLLACRARTDDYTALLVDGLPAGSLRRSLRIEQQVVLVGAVLVGLALGLILAWVTSWGALVGVPSATGAAAGLVATAVIGLALGLVVAWMVRRRAVGFGLVERARAT
jgi:hypothetical protein